MRYLVHVIEETSNHIEQDGEFNILECDVDNFGLAHIHLADSFYVVEATEPLESVIELANIIRAEDEDGDRVKLAVLLKKQKDTKISDPEKSERLSSFVNKYSVANKTKSDLFSSTYEIEKTCDGSKIIELHKIFFYVVKESDILQIAEK